MTNEKLLMELHTGLALVKQQQSEINRRIGLIEKKLDDEDDREAAKRDAWWKWFWQTIGQVLLVSSLVAVGQMIGLEIIG